MLQQSNKYFVSEHIQNVDPFNTVSFTSLHSRLIECRPCGTLGELQPCKGDTLLTAGFNLRHGHAGQTGRSGHAWQVSQEYITTKTNTL